MMEMGLCHALARTVWRGTWIWTDDVPTARNVYALFRRTFTLASAGQLHLDITADSHYTLYIDGQRQMRGPARAPLDYYLYDTLEARLTPGAHCLAVLVHHVGEVNACMMHGRPGLLVDASVTHADEEWNLSTGPEWRCHPATAWRAGQTEMMSHFGFHEECDQACLPAGWTQAAYIEPVPNPTTLCVLTQKLSLTG
jgi:hypothetical protein